MMPRVGVSAIVISDDKVLLGKRIFSHGKNTWSPPGGHLEFGETPENSAKRELEEETGLLAKKTFIGPWTNDYFPKESKHYITLHIFIHEFEGKPQVIEPVKCSSWDWFSMDDLPNPLFIPFQHLIEICNPLLYHNGFVA